MTGYEDWTDRELLEWLIGCLREDPEVLAVFYSGDGAALAADAIERLLRTLP